VKRYAVVDLCPYPAPATRKALETGSFCSLDGVGPSKLLPNFCPRRHKGLRDLKVHHRPSPSGIWNHSSTSWGHWFLGSLVRAQYRPLQKACKIGLFVVSPGALYMGGAWPVPDCFIIAGRSARVCCFSLAPAGGSAADRSSGYSDRVHPARSVGDPLSAYPTDSRSRLEIRNYSR
jgi:hypothetical protein